MPDPITPQAPPVEPSPQPASGSPVPESPSGSQSLITELDGLIQGGQPQKPAEPAKPVEPAKPAEPAKSEEPKPATPSQPAKAPDKGGPAELRKRLAELEGALTKTKAEKEAELAKLNQRIAEFEKRKYLSPEEEERYAAAEKKAEMLEAELESRDFRESKEFKNNYKLKWDRAYQLAHNEISRLQVEGEDGQPRQATPEDFAEVMKDHRAARKFGEDSALVIAHRNTINQIVAEAEAAATKHREEFDNRRKEIGIQSKQQAEQMTAIAHSVEGQLREKHPGYFGDDPADPEGSEAFKKGLQFVEESIQSDTATPQEKASRATLIRYMAGAFPRVVKANQKLMAQIEELNQKIKSLEGTDPGAVGETSGSSGQKAEESNKGVDDLVKAFDSPQ